VRLPVSWVMLELVLLAPLLRPVCVWALTRLTSRPAMRLPAEVLWSADEV